MPNKITLNKVVVNRNRIDFDYTVPDELSGFFNPELNFFYEYPEEFDFSDVPESVLAIPFAMNLMTFAWINGCVIEVPELDEDFYNSLPNILSGIKKVYPSIEFNGTLNVKKIVKNNYDPSSKCTVLFSGGVDAVSTLVSHIDEKPTLINVWGADMQVDDFANHEVFERDLSEFAKVVDLPFFFIRSSLRWCFNEVELQNNYREKMQDSWWHGMQHSIGLLSLLAPYDYINKVSINYIASSYTQKDVGVIRCVNYPFIDNQLKIMSAECVHDGFSLNRISKVKKIVDFVNQTDISINLKVCFKPINGQNCCTCEKCYRTMAAIISVGGDLKKNGFEMNNAEASQKIKTFCDNTIIDENSLPFWLECQEYLNSHKGFKTDISWLENYEFNTYRPSLIKRIKNLLVRLRRKFL